MTEIQESEVYNSQGRVMITAPGVYGGKLCRPNINNTNLVEYVLNINLDPMQNRSTRIRLEAKHCNSDVPTINTDMGFVEI